MPERRPPQNPRNVRPAVQQRRPQAMSSGERRAWQPERGGEAVSGNHVIGPGARGETPDPQYGYQIIRGQWDVARPRVLQLGTMPAPLTPNSTSFPVSTDSRQAGASYACGELARDFDTGDTIVISDGFPVACVLEYGQGSAGSRVMFDWVPGSYNLPPCTFANVSVLAWGPAFESNWNETVFAAAVSPGQLQSAHVPTVSGRYAFAVDDAIIVPVPDHARGFELLPMNFTTEKVPAGSFLVSGAAEGTRDFGNAAYSPAWTPLEVTGGQNKEVQINCLDVGDGPTVSVYLRWYLAL